MIFTGFAPNMQARDVFRALSYLCLPWRMFKLRRGLAVQKAERELMQILEVPYVKMLDSGRSALFAALTAAGIGHGDEVLVQAYTCMVVSNAILWTGAMPVYVDIADDLTMDADDSRAKLTKRTKAIIIQHTFGVPADVDVLVSWAKDAGLVVIEDCAHALGVRHRGKILGTAGDIGIYSFGSDKAVSCARGGALSTGDAQLAEAIELVYARLPQMPIAAIVRHLLIFPIFFAGKALYRVWFGKAFLYLVRRLGITHGILTDMEKRGQRPVWMPARMPNSLAHILLFQLTALQETNNHRQEISKMYDTNIQANFIDKLPMKEGTVYLRYPIFLDNPDKFTAYMKKRGVLLGDWYRTPIAPADSDVNAAHYAAGSCPCAEAFARRSVNLPTGRHISNTDAERILTLIQGYADST